MRERLRAHVSPAMVVAVVALTFGASGVTYAVTKAPKNSVTTKSIVNGAVTGAKVKDNSLRGADISEGTLGIVPNAAQAAHASGADNATNATNATNAANAGHATSADTATGAQNVFGATVNSNAGGTPSVTSTTLPGTTVTRNQTSTNRYLVTFARSLSGCIPVASPTPTIGGNVSEQLSGASSVDVATLNTTGANPATNVDFNLIVVC